MNEVGLLFYLENIFIKLTKKAGILCCHTFNNLLTVYYYFDIKYQ